MVKKVKSIIISGNGTNCEMEMAHALRLAGSDVVDIVHISKLLYGEVSLDDYHFLNLAGGFLDGDDLGAAKAGANRIKYAKVKNTGERLQDQILRFIKQGKLIIGVCNGFQLMVKLGILPGLDGDYLNQKVTLTFNDSAKFEDRWVTLKINEHSPCIFLNGLNKLELPVRHGEGKFITKDEKTMERIKRKNLIAVQYIDIESGKPTQSYPYNPNGSIEAVAGICDETGHLFGLMPHPEAYLHYTNHPLWTRKKLPKEGEGIKIFRNGIKFIRKYL
ncbi:MAG: phosphoribosylformylglycinamidine synthase subunit PurQ [Deltaproteobacteria bacterium]|nr:MAG: phosphoribosylformylglycinamidine synthase subunit PurQ [Deltaproteobacteria bacterium]